MLRPTLLVLALSAGLVACGSSRPHLEGAWRRSHPMPADEGGPAVKLLTDGHFAFGHQVDDGGIAWSGGGTYEHEEGVYRETITYHSDPELVGTTIEFDCVVEDGAWTHRARFERNGRWYDIDEIWTRISRE